MGSGGGYHGAYHNVNFDEMTPEQQQAYLKQQEESRLRQLKYEKQKHRRKVAKGIFFAILFITIIVLVIIALKSCGK